MKKELGVKDVANLLQRPDGGDVEVKDLGMRGIEAQDHVSGIKYLLRNRNALIDQFGGIINPFQGYKIPSVTHGMGLGLNENARVVFVDFERADSSEQEAIIELSSPERASHIMVIAQFYNGDAPDDLKISALLRNGVRFYSRNGYEVALANASDKDQSCSSLQDIDRTVNKIAGLSVYKCPGNLSNKTPKKVTDTFIVPIGYVFDAPKEIASEVYARNADSYRANCANAIRQLERQVQEDFLHNQQLANSRKNRSRYVDAFESFRPMIEEQLEGILNCGPDEVEIRIPHPNDHKFGWKQFYSIGGVQECRLALEREEKYLNELRNDIQCIVKNNKNRAGRRRVDQKQVAASY